MKKNKKSVFLLIILTFIICIFVLFGFNLSQNKTNNENINEKSTYQSINVESVQPDTPYSYVAVEMMGTRQELEITDSLLNTLYEAKNAKEQYKDVKFIAEGVIIIKIAGDNTEYEYGKYYIDEDDNRYIQVNGNEGLLIG